MTEECSLNRDNPNSLSEKMDQLIALIKIAFADRIATYKKTDLGRSLVKKQIYDACRKEPCNRQQLAQIIGKNPDYVSSYLTLMTREGFLITKQEDNETYYVSFI